MLNVYLGNFHPDLEDALCNRISDLKKDDPLSAIAVIVPSDRIRLRIKTLFAVERGINLIGVHFLTFHSLSLKLYEERYGLIKNLIRDDFFFIEFIRHILKEGVGGADLIRQFSATPEGCTVLWRTLRDLMEARVDPDNIMEAVKEGIFSSEDREKITPLSLLYREFLSRKKIAGISDYYDLPETAERLVPSSAYLGKFKEIIYYGFYDLTQIQYDIFCAVVQHYSATLFFPYVEGMPAFTFAGRFYEAYVQRVVSGSKRVTTPPDAGISRHDSNILFPFGHLSNIISTSGAEDEVITAAKAILRLVEKDDYRFHDIGVVARDIDGYIHLIRRIFGAHQIPFVSGASEPVNRFQVAKAVHLLITMPEGNYRRSDIIDLASSPYCRIGMFCPEGIEPRTDIWDLVTRSIGISKGAGEWGRLDRYVNEGLTLRDNEEDEGGRCVVRGVELAGLRRFVSSLMADFALVPPVSSWSDYTERFNLLIRKYIDMPVFVEEAVASLKDFGLISNEVTLSEFIDALRCRLENQRIPVCDEEIAGVQVLDAMAARGIPFKVLFILGMNEKVFPRNIREDPLLRDSARQAMEMALGYKITEKLYGYEEEKLIFYLLLSSAKDRIYLLYQRTDDAGQIKIPSWYISEIKRGYPVKEDKIPRRMTDKFEASEFFSYHLLTPHELSIRLIIEGADPAPAILKFNLNPILYQHGKKTIIHLEDMAAGLSKFDGLTGRIKGYWEGVIRHGTSPTALEMFARCPFSYYARYLLGLRKFERPETIFELPPVEIGNICHSILKRFYMKGIQGIQNGGIEIDRRLAEEADVVFAEFHAANPVRYPVVWEILQERLLTILKSVIEADLSELSVSGFMPYCFEVDVMGYFNATSLPLPDIEGDAGIKEMHDIPLHGVLDRIDIQPDTGLFRIIDYKFKAGTTAKSEDKNLILSAIRGRRLQPPMYILMAIPYLTNTCGVKNPLPDRVSFYYIAPNWPNSPNSPNSQNSIDGKEMGANRAEFPGDCWQSGLSDIGEKIKATAFLLLRGIRDGLYFIVPDLYCKYCDYSAICRKNHLPSRWRAERDRRVKPYYGVRENT